MKNYQLRNNGLKLEYVVFYISAIVITYILMDEAKRLEIFDLNKSRFDKQGFLL